MNSSTIPCGAFTQPASSRIAEAFLFQMGRADYVAMADTQWRLSATIEICAIKKMAGIGRGGDSPMPACS